MHPISERTQNEDDTTSFVSSDSFESAQQSIDDASTNVDHDIKSRSPKLLQLPPEILHHILSYLECQQLAALGRTCQQLRAAANADLLWLDLLRRRIPAGDVPEDSPFPSPSYRHLYICHHPYWFVPRYKIWISDEGMTGKLILCKFDPRRGCIKGYRLLAEHGSATGLYWEFKPDVMIHNFVPHVHLWLDDPVINLSHEISPLSHGRQRWWEDEISMRSGRTTHNTLTSFILARNIAEQYQAPNMEVWPPRTIPDMPRVRSMSHDKFRSKGHKPQRLEEISQTAFRIRHWSQFLSGIAQVGVRIGGEVSTWSTLDAKLYTPTKEKPYQGIFVGDYAGHGCEFVLVLQTDAAPAGPPRSESADYMRANSRAMEENLGRSAKAQSPQPVTAVRPNLDDPVAHSGALEAIKLTGDPNVPRGEHTFIADDIGPDGLIRIASEHPFRGARVVKSRGHVAGPGFQNDKFIPSQLIMVNPDKLAQYWVPIGHISFYERIDIDRLLSNTTYRRASE